MSDKKKKKVVQLTPEQIAKAGIKISITADELTEAELEQITGGAMWTPRTIATKGCACACSPKSGLTTNMMAYSNKALEDM